MNKYIILISFLSSLKIICQVEAQNTLQLNQIELSLGKMITFDNQIFLDIESYEPSFLDSINSNDYFGTDLVKGTNSASINTFWEFEKRKNIQFIFGLDYLTQVNQGRYYYRVDTNEVYIQSETDTNSYSIYKLYVDNNLSYKINYNDVLIRFGGIYHTHKKNTFSFYTGIVIGLGLRINNYMRYKYYRSEHINNENYLINYEDLFPRENLIENSDSKTLINYDYQTKLSSAFVGNIQIPVGVDFRLGKKGSASKVSLNSEVSYLTKKAFYSSDHINTSHLWLKFGLKYQI